jgi:hypothetical protein
MMSKECTTLVNAVEGSTILEILGSPDDLKFRSSMTLFGVVSSDSALPFRNSTAGSRTKRRWTCSRPRGSAFYRKPGGAGYADYGLEKKQVTPCHRHGNRAPGEHVR